MNVSLLRPPVKEKEGVGRRPVQRRRKQKKRKKRNGRNEQPRSSNIIIFPRRARELEPFLPFLPFPSSNWLVQKMKKSKEKCKTKKIKEERNTAANNFPHRWRFHDDSLGFDCSVISFESGLFPLSLSLSLIFPSSLLSLSLSLVALSLFFFFFSPPSSPFFHRWLSDTMSVFCSVRPHLNWPPVSSEPTARKTLLYP